MFVQWLQRRQVCTGPTGTHHHKNGVIFTQTLESHLVMLFVTYYISEKYFKTHQSRVLAEILSFQFCDCQVIVVPRFEEESDDNSSEIVGLTDYI